MDDPNRRKRQNDPPIHATSHPTYSVQDPSQQQRGAQGAPTEQRYRPAPLTLPPSAGRGIGAQAYGGYYHEQTTAFPGPILQNAIPYQTEYSQDGRQAQSFASYNPNMMYSVPQGAAQPSVYDPTQQFAPRQQPTVGMMGSDVGGQYFGGDASHGAAAAASTLPSQAQQPGTSAAVYQQGQLQGYPATMPATGSMAQSQPAREEPAEDPEFSGAAMDEKWAEYQTALAGVFRSVRSGSLETGSESLLGISNWLLSQVAELGLHRDSESLHAHRMKLWDDFNHAWLSIFQRQKDMMESGEQLQRSQSLISKEGLEKMGKELVRLCDGVESHGLVDYQYGVWEEQIIAILGECLDLYDSAGGQSAQAGSSSRQGDR